MKIARIVKTLIVIGLAAGIFGAAGYFLYDIFIKPARLALEEKSQPQPTPTPDPSVAEYERSLKVRDSGNLLEAKAALEDFLGNYPKSPKSEEARDALGTINTEIFFSPTPAPDKIQYVVQKGDALAKIERKLKAPRELIMRTNNLDDPRKLQIGQVLMVSRPDFSITLDTKLKKVVLLNQSKFFKQYHPVKWSAPALRTPGPLTAKVTEKIAWKGGARVAFGTKEYEGSVHWILVSSPGYNIYGESDQENPVGRPQGGVGLSKEQAEELATLVGRNTPVTIQ